MIWTSVSRRMEQTFFSIPLEKYYLKPTRGEGGGGERLVMGPGMEKTTW